MWVIAEDLLNPCTGVLMKAGARWIERPMIEDLAIMIDSRRSILSKGSFALGMIYLTIYEKVYYAFQYGWPGIGRHMCCEPTKEYEEKVLANWKATKEQKALMVSSKCRVWWLVEE
jgi:hypothetical protein